MLKYGELSFDKGASTTSYDELVTSLGDARHSWSVVRNNANNAWYVNLNNGNMNNNNVYNRNVGVGVSELTEDELMRYLLDEELCYCNKHDSYEATRVHYTLSEVYHLAEAVKNGTWEQGKAIVFSIEYPTRREVWAACYTDRILHHDIAPDLIDATENVHTRNGDVSHGNRLNHSAYTAAQQVQRNMAQRPNGYVGTRDLSGFFMSINKQKAAELILSELKVKDNAKLIEKLILHDPTTNCDIRSPMSEMDKIPKNKSLFHAKDGYGLPIGNYYSQLTANAYLGSVDAIANSDKWKGKVGYTRFVDDMCVIADTPQIINSFFGDVEIELTRLELRTNKRKKYLQPVKHGVKFCGYVIHSHGIYISNRTVRGCDYTIDVLPVGMTGATKAIRSLNSYYGFFCHCKAFNIQRRIASKVSAKYGEFIQQTLKGQQIVFSLAPQYLPMNIVREQIEEFINNLRYIRYETWKRKQRRNVYYRHRCNRRSKVSC